MAGEPIAAASQAIILTNYRRAWNIPRILEACLALQPSRAIILIDNSLELDASQFSSVPVTFIQPASNLGAAHRFFLAASLPFRAMICLDDDIFLEPDQIEALFARLEAAPERLHGVWGEHIRRRLGRLSFKGNVFGATREVDILNRVYAFTPAHVQRAMALAKALDFPSWYDIGPTDDILMSFAGTARPLCHDLGPFENCHTSNAEGIAVWRSESFYARRASMIRALDRLAQGEDWHRPRRKNWLRIAATHTDKTP